MYFDENQRDDEEPEEGMFDIQKFLDEVDSVALEYSGDANSNYLVLRLAIKFVSKSFWWRFLPFSTKMKILRKSYFQFREWLTDSLSVVVDEEEDKNLSDMEETEE